MADIMATGGSGFLTGRRDTDLAAALREAVAGRRGDLRTALLRLALAARFFFTELLFMEHL
jgi:hypothetical protein